MLIVHNYKLILDENSIFESLLEETLKSFCITRVFFPYFNHTAISIKQKFNFYWNRGIKSDLSDRVIKSFKNRLTTMIARNGLLYF